MRLMRHVRAFNRVTSSIYNLLISDYNRDSFNTDEENNNTQGKIIQSIYIYIYTGINSLRGEGRQYILIYDKKNFANF